MDTAKNKKNINFRKTVVLDTDAGTDDAFAFMAAGALPGVDIDYIVASKGNTSLEGATRNAVILKKYFGLYAKIVQGKLPKADENVDEREKSTFHGNDGLANISGDMIKETGLTAKELDGHITYERFCEELSKSDEIEYIVIGPVTNLASLLDNDGIREKISKIYIMGGGINEFNCSHGTEFNFSKEPQSVKKVLSRGKDITLFPLDLTNFQRITKEQTDALEKYGTYKHCISFLRYNLQANKEHNGINAAVIHDIMPLLYYKYPEKFTTEETKIIVDKYGAVHKSADGYTVKVVSYADKNLLYDTLIKFFSKE